MANERRRHEVEGRRQEEGYDATVGGVVIVDGSHDAVERLQVAEVAHSLGGGDEDDGNEPYGVAPEELADALLVTENLGSGKEEGDDEPETRQPIFERHEGHLRGAGGDEHPEHGAYETEADGVLEQPQVVAAGGQHAEKEHQREEYHHGLDRHGELHLGHQSHVDGKGGEEGHAQQAGFEPRDEKQQHQPRQGDEGEIVEILKQQHRVGDGKQQRRRHGKHGGPILFIPASNIHHARGFGSLTGCYCSSSLGLRASMQSSTRMHMTTAPRVPRATMTARLG